jgi:hypothetical protein
MKEKLKLVKQGDAQALQEILVLLEPIIAAISSLQVLFGDAPTQAEDYKGAILFVADNFDEKYSEKSAITFLLSCLPGGANRALQERGAPQSKLLKTPELQSLLVGMSRRKQLF